MSKHRHTFVEHYGELVAFGMSREVDENSLRVYLQKFSDDDFTELLIPRLTDGEITELFELMNELMHRHLREEEYHLYFLKDEHREPGSSCPT
ncbi:MAG: cytoplasmic protein [Deltaproteobacteria bacterium]|nr:cytoplasmic protein [Deltaproteobacteria bacterium]